MIDRVQLLNRWLCAALLWTFALACGGGAGLEPDRRVVDTDQPGTHTGNPPQEQVGGPDEVAPQVTREVSVAPPRGTPETTFVVRVSGFTVEAVLTVTAPDGRRSTVALEAIELGGVTAYVMPGSDAVAGIWSVVVEQGQARAEATFEVVLGCEPSCLGRGCGGDGCGGSCGTCGVGLSCRPDEGRCVVECAPECGERACGDDGCGGSCGGCERGACLETIGACSAWQPLPEGGPASAFWASWSGEELVVVDGGVVSAFAPGEGGWREVASLDGLSGIAALDASPGAALVWGHAQQTSPQGVVETIEAARIVDLASGAVRRVRMEGAPGTAWSVRARWAEGRLLVWGQASPFAAPAVALYDPTTTTWRPVDTSWVTDDWSPTVLAIVAGRVCAWGGRDANGARANGWCVGLDGQAPEPIPTLGPSSGVLDAQGWACDGALCVVGSDLDGDRWLQGRLVDGAWQEQQLEPGFGPRGGALVVPDDGGVWLWGGQDAEGLHSDGAWVDLVTGEVAPLDADPGAPSARSNAWGFAFGGSLFVGGGANDARPDLPDAFVFTP